MKSSKQSEQILQQIGWQPYYQQQLTLEEFSSTFPARVMEYHRTEFEISGDFGTANLPLTPSLPSLSVGDWVLVSEEMKFLRKLDRSSSFARKAPGKGITEQVIAANIDTAFIVCSLNADFNLSRIERFLSIVNEAKAEPVVVLTKKDLCENTETLCQQVQRLDSLLPVVPVNGTNSASIEALSSWCEQGKTIVLLGSSGAGKSTLTNTLLQKSVQATGEIREEDSKGRHTTSNRSLHQMEGGALLLDTPGMRELQLLACEEGLAATFHEIEALASQCRFSDCQHSEEPSCAVRHAINSGELDERRLENYQKLRREQAINSASLAQRRASDKRLGKFYKRVISESAKHKRGE